MIILALISIILAEPFVLKSQYSQTYIGIIDGTPKLVDKTHAAFFDLRTKPNHKSTLCTQGMCLVSDERSKVLTFNMRFSEKFEVLFNEDGSLSFVTDDNCLKEKGALLFLGKCDGETDKFEKIPISELHKLPKNERERPPNSDIVFNYGVEDTDHKKDSVIIMNKGDENYSLVPVNRHHNSHTHRVGGFADKAYYTYYSYEPNSRHSAYNFHGKHHGIPRSWSEDV